MAQRPTLPADREQKCSARRSTRQAIAQRFRDAGLATGGLTLSEVARDARRAAALARWNALTPEEQAAKRAVLAGARLKKKVHGARNAHPGDPEPIYHRGLRWLGSRS